MAKLKEQVSDFKLVGQLQDFVIKDGYKIKYLRVTYEDREYWIKLPKELRHSLDPAVKPGCWLEIDGVRKLSYETGKVKFKAYSVQLSANSQLGTAVVVNEPQSSKSKSRSSVLVCQKSNCWKKGGKAVCQAIEANLRDRGLEEQVQIKLTGCLKECKKGPNVVMMPDKARYSKVSPEQIPALIEEHFIDETS